MTATTSARGLSKPAQAAIRFAVGIPTAGIVMAVTQSFPAALLAMCVAVGLLNLAFKVQAEG